MQILCKNSPFSPCKQLVKVMYKNIIRFDVTNYFNRKMVGQKKPSDK